MSNAFEGIVLPGVLLSVLCIYASPMDVHQDRYFPDLDQDPARLGYEALPSSEKSSARE
jgi:hypothetical protein